ncbi:MAG: substrate-binding domain-containing protein [bacterium]
MARPFRIYVAVSEQYGYARQILRGIQRYARQASNLWWFQRGSIDGYLIDYVLGWAPDGIIVQCSGEWLDDLLMDTGIPTVNVSSKLTTYRLPTVIPDNYAAGASAAAHLFDCGLRHLAFWPLGFEGFHCERAAGFIAAVESLDATLHRPPVTKLRTRAKEPPTTAWLKSLPKPVGILCADDIDAARLCEACLVAGIKVPEEVAIVGVGDEEFECELAPIPLSSVTLPSERIGYEAMALLKRMIEGAPPPSEVLRLTPLGVTRRTTTRDQVSTDPYVDEVVNYIRMHATEAINIAEITAHIPLSRRAIEQRFKTERGHTMSEEIHHERCQHARTLLLETELSSDEIAVASGFSDRSHFSRIFQRIIGVTPPAFRKQARGKY